MINLSSFFTENEYHTSPDAPRALLDKCMGNLNWYFIKKYADIIVQNRKVALKNKYDTLAWAKSSYDVFKLIENCGGHFHVSGMENIRNTKGPVVFISNHMSTLETMIFPFIIAPQKEVTFVVKDSLVKHFIFGPIMRARNPIVVGRTDSRADFNTVMKEGEEQLGKGVSVIIFPQSTRSAQFIPKEFNTMGVKLAKAANVPVIPIAIKTDFWGQGKLVSHIGPIHRKKPIYMHFGNPISIRGSGKEEHNSIITFIAENLAKWEE